jgi:RNA polymerase sigma-70 factor (ECF subfamily)
MTMETIMPEAVDSQRIAEWVRDFGGAVRGYLRAMVFRDDLVDDLFQEVFARAWQGRLRYQERGCARAFLLQIADRAACDQFRRLRPETTLGDEVWDLGDQNGSADDPSTNAARSEANRQLDEALNQLAPLQKRALLLRYFGQLSFIEIAATLDCPLNTALSHCRRGLHALRNYLGEDGDER